MGVQCNNLPIGPRPSIYGQCSPAKPWVGSDPTSAQGALVAPCSPLRPTRSSVTWPVTSLLISDGLPTGLQPCGAHWSAMVTPRAFQAVGPAWMPLAAGDTGHSTQSPPLWV